MLSATHERRLDRLWALSFAGWALAGLVAAPAHALPIAAAVAALHGVAAWLFARRDAARRHAARGEIAQCVPSFAVALVAGALTPSPATWAPAVSALFLVGASLALVALARLGRSFAVLPALREVVTGGPYRVVRHPAYLGELLMLGACALALGLVPGVLLMVAVFASFALRIGAEERILMTSERYQGYRARVPYRLLPGVW